MGRNRKPTALLRLSGALKRNPGRYKDRQHEPNNGPLGPAPDHLTDPQKKIWNELWCAAPEDLLHRSDRIMVELICRLMAKLRANGIGGRNGLSAGFVSQLNSLLGKLGLSPADRLRVVAVAERDKNENPFRALAEEGMKRRK